MKSPISRISSLYKFIAINIVTIGLASSTLATTQSNTGQVDYRGSSVASQDYNNYGSGVITFHDQSSQGSTHIINENTVRFVDSSTGATGTIDNLGTVTFSDNSKLGSNVINNVGTVTFNNNSDLQNGTINNNDTLLAGTLVLNDNVTANNAIIVNNANGNVDISGHTGANGIAIGALDSAGTLNLGSKVITLGSSADTVSTSHTIGGTINSDPGSSITKIGAGILNLNTNFDGGLVTLRQGTLNLNTNFNNFNNSLVTVNQGNLNVNGSNIDRLHNGDPTQSHPGGIVNLGDYNSGGIMVTSSVTSSIRNLGGTINIKDGTALGTNITIDNQGSATLDFSSSNQSGFTIGNISSAATLNLGNKNFTIGGNGQDSYITGSALGTNGTMTKVGINPMIYQGDHLGPIVVNGGALTLSGGQFANLTVASGATAQYSNAAASTANAVINNAGTFDISGLTTPSLTIRALDSTGTLNLGSKGLVLGSPADVVQDIHNISGVINASSVSSITQNGLGALSLNTNFPGAVNVQDGVVNISGANTGDLNVASGKAANYTGGAQNAGVINNNGTVDISGISGTAFTVTGINGSGGTFQLGNRSFNIGADNSDSSTSATISGTGGGIIKLGTGALTLAGNNIYTGDTTVSGGALYVNGSTDPSSAVTVNAGATIGGSGVVSGNVTNSGGTIAPGTATTSGTLTIGDYIGSNNGRVRIRLGTTSDMLVINGNASGNTAVTLQGGGVSAPIGGIKIIETQSSTPDAFALGNNVAGAYRYNLTYHSDPTPSTTNSWYLETQTRTDLDMYSAIAPLVKEYNMILMGDMHKRTANNFQDRQKKGSDHVWIKTFGAKGSKQIYNFDDAVKYKFNVKGIQFGQDFISRSNDSGSSYNIGYLGAIGQANSKIRDASLNKDNHSTLDAYTIGAHATYTSKDKGYWDVAAQASRFRAPTTTVLNDQIDPKGYSISLSSEIGAPIMIGDNSFFEPQIQMTYQDVKLHKTTNDTSTITFGNGQSFRLRTGGRLVFDGSKGYEQDYDDNKEDSYFTGELSLNYVEEFKHRTSMTVGGIDNIGAVRFTPDGNYKWIEVGATLNGVVRNNVNLYGGINYQTATNHKSHITIGNVGIKINL